jgi:hypothetical protein
MSPAIRAGLTSSGKNPSARVRPGPSSVRKVMSIDFFRFGCDVGVNEMSATAAHTSSAVLIAASTAARVSEAGAFPM